jgi:hypothetical protein
MRSIRNLAALFVLLCTLPLSFAAGPVDAEIGAVYWNSEYSGSGVASLSSDAGSPAFRASLWLFNKYGVKAGVYKTDLQDFGAVEDSSYTSIDLLWRPLSPTSNNYLAVGLGWQEMDLNAIGLEGDTSGARITVEGRVGLGTLFYAYGEGSYMPDLDEAVATTIGLGRFEDLSGQELELGVSWKMAPFVNLRAGYRMHRVEFNQTGLDPLLGFGNAQSGTAESDGYLLGLVFNF